MEAIDRLIFNPVFDTTYEELQRAVKAAGLYHTTDGKSSWCRISTGEVYLTSFALIRNLVSLAEHFYMLPSFTPTPSPFDVSAMQLLCDVNYMTAVLQWQNIKPDYLDLISYR